jgi:hypothetical protein
MVLLEVCCHVLRGALFYLTKQGVRRSLQNTHIDIITTLQNSTVTVFLDVKMTPLVGVSAAGQTDQPTALGRLSFTLPFDQNHMLFSYFSFVSFGCAVAECCDDFR